MDTTLQNTRVRVDEFRQAYKEAPWRTQRKWIALFLIAVISIGLVAGIYLNVSAGAALAGRAIQSMERDIARAQQANADLETKLATQLSTEVMAERAMDMGFEETPMESIEYVVVPGYFPPQPVVLSYNKSANAAPADTFR